MSNIAEENQIDVQSIAVKGQRVVQVTTAAGVRYYPIGLSAAHEPGASVAGDIYRCASVNGDSWSGYQAFQQPDGVWVFSDELTTDLPIVGYLPTIGDVFNRDTSVHISDAWNGTPSLPSDGLVFYAPLTSREATATTGQEFTYTGNGIDFNENGLKITTPDSFCAVPCNAFPSGNSPVTVIYRLTMDEIVSWENSSGAGQPILFYGGMDYYELRFITVFFDNHPTFSQYNKDWIFKGAVPVGTPTVVASVFANATVSNYLNSQEDSVFEEFGADIEGGGNAYIACRLGDEHLKEKLTSGRVAHLAVYNRALSSREIWQAYQAIGR